MPSRYEIWHTTAGMCRLHHSIVWTINTRETTIFEYEVIHPNSTALHLLMTGVRTENYCDAVNPFEADVHTLFVRCLEFLQCLLVGVFSV